MDYLQDIYTKWQSVDQDPKIEKLKELLKQLKNRKIILFTEFIDTADYLRENLKELYGDRAFVYSSRSGRRDREKIERNFNPNHLKREDTIDLLITTDALVEGINLHASNTVINYDIPWNPTKVLQRVGRVNRIGTKHDEIFIYNFFPASQIEENIGLEASALSKLQAFHHALGEDAKYLDPEVEEIDTHRLFSVINSTRFLEEEEEEETELKYLKLLRDIRDNNPKLYEKIKRLPKKARTARKGDKQALVTLFRRGKLLKVFISDSEETKELDFFEAVKLIECDSSEKKLNLDEEFYKLLRRNKEAFMKAFVEDTVRKKRSSKSQTYKFIAHLKALLNHPEISLGDREFLKLIMSKAQEGAFPEKTLLRKLNSQLVASRNSVHRKIELLRSGIPEEYLSTGTREVWDEEIEVILSVYLKL